MRTLKDIIDTWNIIEKYEVKGYISENGVVMIPEEEYKRIMGSVKNKKYIQNLVK